MSSPEKKIGEFIQNEEPFEHPFERVINDHVIVVTDEFRYSGKIVIPDAAKRKPTKGRVIALADNILDIKLNDRVLYSQFAGYALVFEGLPVMRVIGYNEILSILKKNAPELSAEAGS